jgi:hypothetical protein
MPESPVKNWNDEALGAAYHVTRSGLRELLNGIDQAPPYWRVEFLQICLRMR